MSVHIKTGSCVARSWLKLETRKNRGIGKKKNISNKKKIVENKKKKVACVMRYVVIDRKRLYQLDGGGFRFGS
jgi:hypothetical protein